MLRNIGQEALLCIPSMVPSSSTGAGAARGLLPALLGKPNYERRQELHLVVKALECRSTAKTGPPVIDPGHANLEPSDRERAQFGLPSALGHSPYGISRSVRNRFCFETPSGDVVAVRALQGKAKPFAEDARIGQPDGRLDLGELTQAQAARLTQFAKSFDSNYDVTGRDGVNCVTALQQCIEHVYGTKLELQPGSLPQDLPAAVLAAGATSSVRQETE